MQKLSFFFQPRRLLCPKGYYFSPFFVFGVLHILLDMFIFYVNTNLM